MSMDGDGSLQRMFVINFQHIGRSFLKNEDLILSLELMSQRIVLA